MSEQEDKIKHNYVNEQIFGVHGKFSHSKKYIELYTKWEKGTKTVSRDHNAYLSLLLPSGLILSISRHYNCKKSFVTDSLCHPGVVSSFTYFTHPIERK